MKERMTKPGWLLGGLIVALLSLATTPAQAQLGIIPGVSGSSFNLSTGTGHITTPDGDSLLIWGYGSGIPQYPGPTLIVNQGDTVTINLTNNLPQPTSIVFPGQQDDPTTPADESVTASGGTCPGASGCLLTAEAAAGGGSVSYTFTATHAGTYLYHSGTDSELQIVIDNDVIELIPMRHVTQRIAQPSGDQLIAVGLPIAQASLQFSSGRWQDKY